MSLRRVNWHEWLWWCKENFIPWGPISLNLHCWKLQTWKMYSKFKYLTPISSHVPVKVNVVVKTYLCIIHIYSLHLHSFFQYFRSYWFSTMSFVEIFAEWQSFHCYHGLSDVAATVLVLTAKNLLWLPCVKNM